MDAGVAVDAGAEVDAGVAVDVGAAVDAGAAGRGDDPNRCPLKKNFIRSQAATQLPSEQATEISSAVSPKVPRLFTTSSFAPACRPKKNRRSHIVKVMLLGRNPSHEALRNK